MKNSIFLRRKSKIIVCQDTHITPIETVCSFNKNIESLGYILSPSLIEVLCSQSTKNFDKIQKQILCDLKIMVGSHKYKPMYPNFPQQVMDASEAELYVNAMLHYFGDDIGLRILPKYKKEKREILNEEIEQIKLKTIDLGDDEEFNCIFQNLLQAKTSISDTDKEDLKWFLLNVNGFLPDKIPFKETMAFVLKVLFQNKNLSISKYIKTATDVLRLATSLSEGDVTLKENTKFIKFKRSSRKLLLSLLENIVNDSTLDEMFKHRGRWLRLGEILHPSEYAKFVKTNNCFRILRNEKHQTFNSKIEQLLLNNDTKSVVNLLITRPSEFARRLDHILRLKGNIKVFESVADKVSTPVLLQVLTHFKNKSKTDIRAIFPKGNVAKVMLIQPSKTISKIKCEQVVCICENALINRFSALPPLENVFIDKDLKDYLVPFSQRSASKTIRTIVRGSKIPFDTSKNTIRFFIWWKDLEENNNTTYGEPTRVDIDLSAILYDKNFEYLEHVSYTNLRSNKYKSYHSGDITSAPKGACEFIDVDIDSVIKYGGRYIVPSVYSFTRQPFTSVPECSFGWMMREDCKSGEIFDAKTVIERFDITSNSEVCLPIIIDLVEKCVCWADISMKENTHNNFECIQNQIPMIGKAITNLVKPNLYDLFMLHTTARSENVVLKKEEANTIFSIQEGITPFDIEKIMCDFL